MNEDLLKTQMENEIFNNYNQCVISLEKKKIGDLCVCINKWAVTYKIIKIEKDDNILGLIYEIIDRFLLGNNNVPKTQSGFFSYLVKSLKREVSETKRKESPVRISKRQKENVSKVLNIINMRKIELGRPLTNNEVDVIISNNAKNPAKIKELYNICSFNKRINYLDPELHIYKSPEDELFDKDIFELGYTLNNVLSKQNQKKSACLASLVTKYCCFDKEIDPSEMLPGLDLKMINNFKITGKAPSDADVYLGYYTVKPDSAKRLASNLIGQLRKELRKKCPELVPRAIA